MNSVEIINRMLCHQRAELRRAEIIRLIAIMQQIIVATVAAVSVFYNESAFLLGLAVLGGIATGIWFFADRYYRRHRAAGDQARRLVLVTSGLGENVADPSTFSENCGADIENMKPLKIEEYFATRAAPGMKRLSEMLDESSFFTGALQRKSGEILKVLVFIIFTLSVLIVLSIALRASGDGALSSARVFLAFLVFLLSSDVLGAAIGHHEAGAEMARIRLRLDAARARNYPTGDVLLLMSDYNAAVEAAPLILPKLYRFNSDRLNKDWSEYKEFTGIGS